MRSRLYPQGAGPYYQWKKANGRPTGAVKPPSIASIVTHLRDAPIIDPDVLTWLADQFDPLSPRDSHFVFKQARKPGRPLRRSKSLRDQVAVVMLGLRIELKRREDEKLGPGYGKLEGALQYFVDGHDKRYKPMTRSRARRAYDVFKKKMAKN